MSKDQSFIKLTAQASALDQLMNQALSLPSLFFDSRLSVLIVAAVMSFLLGACAPEAAKNSQWGGGNPTTDLKSAHSGLVGNYSTLIHSQRAWEIIDWGGSARSSEFTSAALSALHKYGGDLLASQPQDVESFCHGYANLRADQKTGFWVALVAGMVSRESGFEPTAMFRESGMGQDHVTGEPLWSEGLLQISYQDQLSYKNYVPEGACDFDYQADRNLPRKDARRSLQDPSKNLSCGIAMINSLIRQDNRIAGFNNGYYQGAARYWAVLRRNPSLSTIRLRALNYCEAIANL